MKKLFILLCLGTSIFAGNCNLKSKVFRDGKIVNYDNHVLVFDGNRYNNKAIIKGTGIEVVVTVDNDDYILKSSDLIDIKKTSRIVEKYGDTVIEKTLEGEINQNLISFFNDSRLISTLTCFMD